MARPRRKELVYKLPEMHSNQKVIEASSARFKVIDAGKRFGKSDWLIKAMVKKFGLLYDDEPHVFWYIAPTLGQSKSIAWDYFKRLIPREILKRDPMESELKFMHVNGNELILKGTDHEDGLRGPFLHGAGFDERAYQTEHAWGSIVRGQLKPTGWAWFISSPNWKGRNHWSRFCEEKKLQALTDPEWAYWHFTCYDNPVIPRSEIEQWRAETPEYRFNVEYLAQHSDLSGQLYSEFSTDRNIYLEAA